METKEIIKIIKTQKEWDSKELIKKIKEAEKNEIHIEFHHIGGYELLRDGTQTDVCKSLKDIQTPLKGYDIEFDEEITDPYKLVESVDVEWEERWNDGGGSGWIEY